MNVAIIALILVGAAETAVLWSVARNLRRLDRVEGRLAHLSDALALLTETAEAGFRASAQEIARVAEITAPRPVVTATGATRRMTAASRRGKTLSDIAAEERMSEGEVNLRLHLAKAASTRAQARRAQEGSHAALRP
jgi:hypothetical protein